MHHYFGYVSFGMPPLEVGSDCAHLMVQSQHLKSIKKEPCSHNYEIALMLEHEHLDLARQLKLTATTLRECFSTIE